MPKKPPTEKQLAARAKFAEAARARSAKAKAAVAAPPAAPEDIQEDFLPEDISSLTKQIEELKTQMASLSAQGPKPTSVLNNRPSFIGIKTKYIVDTNYYPDPSERLRQENRLKRFAFDENYELDFKVEPYKYETKTEGWMQEPRFTIELRGIVRDKNGERVKILNPKTNKLEEKRTGLKRAVFFEDPQTAIIMANDLGLPIDETNERQFLDEMRYIRIRDWLLEAFYPPFSTDTKAGKKEEVVDGRLVEVFTVSSTTTQEIPFDEIRKG